MSDSVIVLVDCASFFASCERVFHPALEGKPVVVLSNNDGCVVAMSAEAKLLGIPMGIPWFKLSAWAHIHGVVACSSNYELYGSLSARVMEVIGRHTSWQEIYSIDESFIQLRGSVEMVKRTCHQIRREVLQMTGVPVRIGIARTKTLAKLAIMGAKSNPALDGVCHFDRYDTQQQAQIMEAVGVTQLWGVGSRYGKRLATQGIYSVKDLRDADPRIIRRRFSVVLQRTVYELRGIRCIEFEEEREYKDQLIFSRSFSHPVTTPEEMQQVLSVYAQRVSKRLRNQGQVAKTVAAWAMTAHHQPSTWHSAHSATSLSTHTQELVRIAKAAQALLPRMRPGSRYVRAGVVLMDLTPVTDLAPLAMFLPEFEGRNIGHTLDRIEEQVGKGSIGVGRGGLKHAPRWNMRRGMLSPRDTTHWDELCTVKAS